MYRPTEKFRYTFKQGMSGWDVWALQLNLPNIIADGAFGPLTKKAVETVQKQGGLSAVDGIAGPLTQRYIVISKVRAYDNKYKLPPGTLRGLAEGESGYFIACTSGISFDGGRDYGALQDHVVPSQLSDTRLKKAFYVNDIADRTGAEIYTAYKRFLPRIRTWLFNDEKANILAWELAILNHNWPYAADRLSRNLTIYADGSDNEPKQWIITASGGRLQTAAQWVKSYIESKTMYITYYPISI